MQHKKTLPQWTAIIVFGALFLTALYFSFAAVQGDYGVFRQVQLEADLQKLEVESARIRSEVEAYETLTRRMSDNFLDLDLLDEKAREVLGMVRSNEVVLK